MAILSFNIAPTGQSQKPQHIYIETTDTVAEVTTIGYLDALERQGVIFSSLDLAVISTKLNQNAAQSQVGLYALSQVGSEWKATHITGSGVAFNPAYNYDGSSPANPSITGNWLHQGGFNVQAGSGNVTLQSDSGIVQILAPNAGQSILLDADTINVLADNTLILNSPVVDVVSTGPVYIEAGETTINSPVLKLQGLTNSATGFNLFYNNLNNEITFGPAAGGVAFDPSFNYTITGDWTFQGIVDINTAQPVSIISSNATKIIIENTNSGIELQGPSSCIVSVGTFFGWFTATAPLIGFTAQNIFYDTGLGVNCTFSGPNVNYTIPGDFNLNAPFIKMNSIPAITTSQALYIDPVTFLVSKGPAGSPAWSDVILSAPGSYTLAPFTSYTITSAGVVLNLPATAAETDYFEVVGNSVNNFTLNAGGGQTIRNVSTVGTALTSLSGYVNFKFKCVTTDTEFSILSLSGNVNIV